MAMRFQQADSRIFLFIWFFQINQQPFNWSAGVNILYFFRAQKRVRVLYLCTISAASHSNS